MFKTPSNDIFQLDSNTNASISPQLSTFTQRFTRKIGQFSLESSPHNLLSIHWMYFSFLFLFDYVPNEIRQGILFSNEKSSTI